MHRASPRVRRAATLLVVLASMFGFTPTAFGRQEAGSPGTATLTQDGWWNRAKGPQPDEPANPLRSKIGGSIPGPSTVPENGLGVGAAAGDPDKVAAIGIILDAAPDALVDRLMLSLKETPADGSNLNSGDAKVIACPITAFWAGVKNGDFVNRPVCDESLGAPGNRGDDGSWTFDLTALAGQWVDPASGLQQNGVLLIEAVAPPVSFQTSFLDIASGKVTLDFAAIGGFGEEFASDEFVTGDESFESPRVADEVPFDTGADFGGETFDDGSFGALDPTASLQVPTGAPQLATPVSGSRAALPVAQLGRLPIGAVILFALLLGGVGLFLSLVLAPLGKASATPARAGGVSRALAEREAQRRNS